MGKIDDLTGRRFGLLTAETMVPERSGGYVQYACRCDCGQIIFANGKQLKHGTKKGCPDCVKSSCSRRGQMDERSGGVCVHVAMKPLRPHRNYAGEK